MKKTRIFSLLLAFLLGLGLLSGCSDRAMDVLDVIEQVLDDETEASEEVPPTEDDSDISSPQEETEPPDTVSLDEDGVYTSPEDVAAYFVEYGRLPDNYITKREAEALGWDSSSGNLNEVAPGKSIGGDRYGNYEKLLPSADGRSYTECDVNYSGGYRGGERLVFSDDGLIYYTADHYQSFTLLYKDGIRQ